MGKGRGRSPLRNFWEAVEGLRQWYCCRHPSYCEYDNAALNGGDNINEVHLVTFLA